MKYKLSVFLFFSVFLADLLCAQVSGKILIIVTSADTLLNGKPAGYFLPELTDYHKVLSGQGYEFVIASPKGGEAPMYHKDEFMAKPAYAGYLEKTGLLQKIRNTIPLAEVKPSDYIAIHCVGGYATLMDFPSDLQLKRIIRHAYENGKIISAVCHGPSALLNVKLSTGKYLIEGMEITSRSSDEDTGNGKSTREEVLKRYPLVLEEELRKQGAVYTKADPKAGHIAVSGKLVTGQGVPSTVPLAEAVLDLLNKSKNIRD